MQLTFIGNYIHVLEKPTARINQKLGSLLVYVENQEIKFFSLLTLQGYEENANFVTNLIPFFSTLVTGRTCE
jgi:hypothetical protein